MTFETSWTWYKYDLRYKIGVVVATIGVVATIAVVVVALYTQRKHQHDITRTVMENIMI